MTLRRTIRPAGETGLATLVTQFTNPQGKAAGRWLAVLLCLFAAHARGADNRLAIGPAEAGVYPAVGLPLSSNRLWTLEASTNLLNWSPAAVLHSPAANPDTGQQAPLSFRDPAGPFFGSRFYRASSRLRTTLDDWKNQIQLANEPFFSALQGLGMNEIRWIKFAIVLNEPFRVYFQDSAKYLLHYDFARVRLPQFKALSRAEFDAISLYTNGQQVVLGSILLPYEGTAAGEYGIQFVGLNPYPAEEVARWFDWVRSAVSEAIPGRAIYIPVFEQSPAAQAQADYLRQHGVELGSTLAWTSGDIVYSSGWAIGRLKYVAGATIAAAYAAGQLLPTDILLTDTVPAEVPYVAGIVAMQPATPNSHVAILSRSYGIPFAYLSLAADRSSLAALEGQEILLRANADYWQSQVRFLRLTGQLAEGMRQELAALKVPKPLAITPKASLGKISAGTESLTPADMRFFGGKASHFGFLRRAVPSNSPPAIAFSFDLWDEFLDQPLAGGKTLRNEIHDRLAGFTYPPNQAAVQTNLATIRKLITKTAQFSPEQKSNILAALTGFDPRRNVRFRSSTNVEDSESFTGAGLYDSFSGCLADDLDGDEAGPSQCDPSEPEERGVFRAMQKVYASFYNDNAFLERLRRGVDENAAGMAILAHHSTPDENEMANGVATFKKTGATSNEADLVTQAGAVSVSNPDNSAVAERVQVYRYATETYYSLRERSSQVPLGQYVLKWQAEYQSLYSLMSSVAAAYQKYYPAKTAFNLDFEYKKVEPGQLVLKQVRPLPPEATGASLTAWLLNEPSVLTVQQGEYGSVFAKHRLKSRWQMATPNYRMTAASLAAGLYTNTALEYVAAAARHSVTNGLGTWPDAKHSVNAGQVTDTWSLPMAGGQRRFELVTQVTSSVTPPATPIFTLRDFQFTLNVTYEAPQVALGYDGAATQATNDTVRLQIQPVLTPACLRQTRTITAGGVRIDTIFYWPEPPKGPTAGYTAPLAEWVETRITGLTATPLVLHDYFAQTYSAGHHNFFEDFIFEPQLDPEIPAAQLEELAKANVRYIYGANDGVFSGTRIAILGQDNKFRFLGK